MSQDLSYLQLKHANEARVSVSLAIVTLMHAALASWISAVAVPMQQYLRRVARLHDKEPPVSVHQRAYSNGTTGTPMAVRVVENKSHSCTLLCNHT